MDWMVSIAVRRSLMGSLSSPSLLWAGRRFCGVFTADVIGGETRRSRLLYNSRRVVKQSLAVPANPGRAPKYTAQRNLLQSADVKYRDSAAQNVDLTMQRSGDVATHRHSSQDLVTDLEAKTADLDSVEPGLVQGSKEWFALRENRITASSFGNCLGRPWRYRRAELWEEKIGLREPCTGNTACNWGSSQESNAVERYKMITGNTVEHVGFKIYYPEDEYLSWLGASPDGIITYAVDNRDSHATDEKTGILEVKCPFNKGFPESANPPEAVPFYYIPQAQGLLEIFDQKFMDFYIWTINGSSVFRIERDPEYWGLMFQIISEFWWGHVIPAKCALRKGKSGEDVRRFRPEDHPAANKIQDMSEDIARNSRLIWRESRGHVLRV